MTDAALLIAATFESDEQAQRIAAVVNSLNQLSWEELKAQTGVGQLRSADSLDRSGSGSLRRLRSELKEAFCLPEAEVESASVLFGAHATLSGSTLSLTWYAIPNPRERASRVAAVLTEAGGRNLMGSLLGQNGGLSQFQP